MDDLNLDFDIQTKTVSIPENINDNLGFSKDESIKDNNDTNDNFLTPSLNVAGGIELLNTNNIDSFDKPETKKDS